MAAHVRPTLPRLLVVVAIVGCIAPAAGAAKADDGPVSEDHPIGNGTAMSVVDDPLYRSLEQL